jgi:cholesterol oxidase
MFVPKGLQRSYDTLRRAHGPQNYSHAVISNYAHLDLWLGENAERDVWPTALAELEKHN